MILEVALGVLIGETAKMLFDRYAKNGMEKRLERIEQLLKKSDNTE